MEYYRYLRNGTNYDLAQPLRRGLWRSRLLSFPSAISSASIPTPAAGEYFAPSGPRPAPLAVVAHGMGATSLAPARLLAGALQGAGWACYVPHLPILPSRAPMMAYPKTLRPQDWSDLYRTSVIEMRQALDWAEGRDELDHRRTAIAGISFGGFVAAITMGLDRRLGAGVMIESGGNAITINQLAAPCAGATRALRPISRPFKPATGATCNRCLRADWRQPSRPNSSSSTTRLPLPRASGGGR